jgi:hypothetical protein
MSINSHMIFQHPPAIALDEYRLGVLGEPDARAVSNHLLWCGECRRTVWSARELARLVEAIVSHDAVEEYTAETQREAPERSEPAAV